MKMCALKVGVYLFTFAGLFLGSSTAYADNDVDPAKWDGTGAKVPPITFFGIDKTNNVIEITTISILLADGGYGAMKHDNDGTNDYAHYHGWDTDANAKKGGPDFSGDNQGYAQTFWDFAFGVNANTGNGTLNGGKVTNLAQKATMNGDCETFAFTTGKYKGTWGYALANGTVANSVAVSVAKEQVKGTVKANDTLYYANGGAGLGYHFTLVSAANGTNTAPTTLQWKYQYSGTYQLVPTKAPTNSPMYWVTGAMAKGVTPKQWKLDAVGAGDPNAKFGNAHAMFVLTPK
jgi:hypothetical protein